MHEKIEFNDIGISSQLDYKRIKKLLILGLMGSMMNAIGDFLLGYGIENTSLSGMERLLSKYASISDARMFWSALLGLLGIVLAGLSLFGIYRIIAGHSSKLAHHFRTGIFGYCIFGPLFHVLCLVECFFYKYLSAVSPDTALSTCLKSALYFMIPGTIFFMIAFYYWVITMIIAFAKKKTDYPKVCAIFNPLTIMIICLPLSFINNPIVSAISASWISLGMLFMFGGLLIMTKKLKLDK